MHLTAILARAGTESPLSGDTLTRGSPLTGHQTDTDVLKLGKVTRGIPKRFNPPTPPGGTSSPQPLARLTRPSLPLGLGGRFQRTVAFFASTNAANVSGRRAPARRGGPPLPRQEARTPPGCPPPTSGGLHGDGVAHDGRNKYGTKLQLNVPKVGWWGG